MKDKSEVSALLRVAGEKKGLLTVASIFSALSSLLQIVPFIAVYNIIEELLNHAGNIQGTDKSQLMYWGTVALLSLIAALAAFYIGLMCSHIAAFNILYQLRLRLAEHISKVPMGYHTKTTTGELKKIIEVSVEKIERFIAHQLPDTVSAIMIPVFLIGSLFWLDWRLSLVLLIPVVVGFWVQMRMFNSDSGRQAYRDFQYAVEEMNAAGIQYVRGMPAVKVFGIKAESFLTFKQAVTRYRDLSLQIVDLCKHSYSLFFVLVTSLFTFITPVGIFLAANQTNIQSFAATFILFLLVTPSLSTPLLQLLQAGSAMREIAEGNKRIEAVFSEPATAEAAIVQTPETYQIQFHNVSFAYVKPDSKDYKPVLKNISFTAKAGEMTALVGPSGGGKSTIANLLLRFWDVEEGKITIGGVPIQNIALSHLMDIVSFVFQDVHLFHGTIEENIRMGNHIATHKELIDAAKRACCHDFIENLADGYQTKIGEQGTYLSGGEAQRIAIARALLKNAPILVLDEATAYADAENEQKIQQGLAELIRGKTVLIIAHRLSSIRNAEQILIIRQGEVAECGTHDELRALQGLYEQMWLAHMHASSWHLGIQNSPSAITESESSGMMSSP